MVEHEAMRPCPQCGTQCAESHKYCPVCGFPVGTLRSTQADDKLIGQELPGGYFIIDLLSVGGMGRVYRAEQRALGRTVAVKIIHPHLLSDENSSVRFMTEARAASQLNHPNSVSVIDFGRTSDGQPYLVMEFLRGKDLARVAYEDGPLSFKRVVDILRQVLSALSEAHEMGIVHRDLKPENVLCEQLRRGGDHVKVVDFGLAKLKLDTSLPNVTSPGIVCGTPDYMAPEQGRGDPIDGRTDLYAVGIILFQLLTGRLPFEAESPTQVVMMHLSLPVPDPAQVAPERNIPQSLIDVVNKALEKDAEHRYQDAVEFSDALKEALAVIEDGERISLLTPASFGTVQCGACYSVVPIQKFCGECGARLSAAAAEPMESVTFPLPFVGREDDLAWLADRREKAALEGGVVGARLVGEFGIGKSRLIHEFLSRVEALGDLVVHVSPDRYWAEVAYHGLRGALASLLAHRMNGGGLPDVVGAPDGVEEAIDEVFGASSAPDARSVLERRFALSEALRWALTEASVELSRRSPGGVVVLVLDDIQRLDGATRGAFADALGEPPTARVVMLAAHAPGFETGWSAEHAARVLSGLPRATVTRWLSPGLEQHLSGDVRGVSPMYLEQALRFAQEGGEEPPSRLADLVAERVASLDPDARRVLQALAVLGDDVEPLAISAMVPSVVDVLEALNLLVQAGMVRRAGGTISTAHPLLHDLVLAVIPAGVRRDLHLRAVRVAAESGAPLEAHALHAFYSQDAFQALLLLEQVAKRATARGDAQAAVLALRRGLELARREIARGELDDPLRAVLIFSRKLGDALTRAGDFSDAEGVLREALDLAGPGGTDRAQVLSALAHVAHGRSRHDDAHRFISEAIEVARQSGAHELLRSLESTRRDWAV